MDASGTATRGYGTLVRACWTGHYEGTSGSQGNFAVIRLTSSPLTAIGNETETVNSFSLAQNYPNPFNPNTKIQFSISKSVFAKLTIYDITGRVMAILVNEDLKPGIYEVEWDASHRASGVYYYKLETESYTETKKMVLIK